MRGGTLRFIGSNLDQISQVEIPGVAPITNIEVVKSGVPSEIRVVVPHDGPKPGLVKLTTKSGDVITTITELNYTEGLNPANITMTASAMPGDKIKEILEGRGKMFVAMANDKVVGTGAYLIKQSHMWCLKGKCAYLCFGAILPEYNGQGIHKRLHVRLEDEALANGIDVLMFDTHERNQRMLEIQQKNDFRAVDVKICKDHYDIVMMKWRNGCPYSEVNCKYQYLLHKWYKKLRYKPGRIKRFGL
jgi:GNAT superfamily N-acetyltransferase